MVFVSQFSASFLRCSPTAKLLPQPIIALLLGLMVRLRVFFYIIYIRISCKECQPGDATPGGVKILVVDNLVLQGLHLKSVYFGLINSPHGADSQQQRSERYQVSTTRALATEKRFTARFRLPSSPDQAHYSRLLVTIDG